MPADKTFRIKYDIHCQLQNFFGKEILVHKCWSEIHAKVKLNEMIKNKYGKEFSYIIVVSCKEEGDDIFKMFGDIFNPGKNKETLSDMLKNIKNETKKPYKTD